MSIPCDTHHLTPFYIIFWIMYCVWKVVKRHDSMIYKNAHTWRFPSIHCNRCVWWTFECHIYSSSLPTTSATTISKLDDAFCNFQTQSLTHDKGFLQLHVIYQLLYTLYICLYFYTNICIYKTNFTPSFFASFKFLYASMHSDVSQFCTNTTFIIVNCIPPLFSSFRLTMYVCVP